eukprot:m.171898 g.171898  ORF g.171898 m.171898 type:complete len:154 (+) comp21273_c0_seq1:7620-8081(+)
MQRLSRVSGHLHMRESPAHSPISIVVLHALESAVCEGVLFRMCLDTARWARPVRLTFVEQSAAAAGAAALMDELQDCSFGQVQSIDLVSRAFVPDDRAGVVLDFTTALACGTIQCQHQVLRIGVRPHTVGQIQAGIEAVWAVLQPELMRCVHR